MADLKWHAERAKTALVTLLTLLVDLEGSDIGAYARFVGHCDIVLPDAISILDCGLGNEAAPHGGLPAADVLGLLLPLPFED